MEKDEEARQIAAEVAAGNFILTAHGGVRSLARQIPIEEIQCIARTYYEWKWQEDRKTHLFAGFMLNGKGGGFTAKLEGRVVIVTVFKRKPPRRLKGKRKETK